MGHDPAQVGPYTLGPELGRGASGIVYEATDGRLGRKVALKVLAEDVARTPEQRARFAREARLLAAVQHPNVAAVYGVEEQGGRVWLALEHLAGESLADALARGPLPIEDALDVARQIADGLEAAHEAGVVHRDLKPANVKRAADGTIKVLDFGLAKPVREGVADSADLSSDGLILGTPLYMSPEQLRGRVVDRRADVWAFGCVLWELLTGRRAFGGETTADVLHAILERDPDPARLPPRTPARVRELVARCLQKDPRRRLRDVGDARVELEAALAERAWTRAPRASLGAGSAGPARRPGAGALALALGVLAAGLLAGWWAGRRGARSARPSGPLRLVLDVPRAMRASYPRLAPDGRTLVVEVVPDGDAARRHLVARRLDAFEAVDVPGTRGVETLAFEPGGERLAVVREVEGARTRYDLAVVHLDGSRPPRLLGVLPEAIESSGGVAWLDDGRIALALRPRKLLLFRVDGADGADGAGGAAAPREVDVQLDPEEWPSTPEVVETLPGTGLLLARSFHQSPRVAQNVLLAIDPDTGAATPLVENASYAAWVGEPDEDAGHLLYSRADVLLALPFDRSRLAATGEAQPLAQGLQAYSAWSSGPFHASPGGAVVWTPGGLFDGRHAISWVEDGGAVRPWSSDGKEVEGYLTVDATARWVTAVVAGANGSWELWGAELEAERLRPLLAEPGCDHLGGIVAVDERRVYACRLGGGQSEVWSASLDALDEGELLFRVAEGEGRLSYPELHADGRILSVLRETPTERSLLAFDLTREPPLEPVLVHAAPPSARQLRLTPDGRWLSVFDRDAPPVVRPVLDDGTAGPPTRVPTGGRDLVGAWWDETAGGPPYLLHLMPEGSDEVLEVEVRPGPEGLSFGELRTRVHLEGRRFFDAAPAGEGRYLGVVVDPAAWESESVHLLLDARAALAGPR